MLTIKGIYGREMYETWYKMNVMLESGLDIRPIITHRLHTRIREGVRGDDLRSIGAGGSRLALDRRARLLVADTWDDSCVLRHPLGMPRGRFVAETRACAEWTQAHFNLASAVKFDGNRTHAWP